MTSYDQTKTSRDRVVACDPFELTRVRVWDKEETKLRTFRIIVYGKRGLGSEANYDDVPVACVEELAGKDRLGGERWIVVDTAGPWADALAQAVMYERELQRRGLADLARIIGCAGDAGEIKRALERLQKNLGPPMPPSAADNGRAFRPDLFTAQPRAMLHVVDVMTADGALSSVDGVLVPRDPSVAGMVAKMTRFGGAA